MTTIYQPEEDSYLMSNILENQLPALLKLNPNLNFLEIGCGSGIQLQKALEGGLLHENILGCDILHESVKHCKRLGFNCIKSNLFSNIPLRKFDLIIFNPPYLQEDFNEPEDSKLSTTGGELGSELINEFLHQAKDFLNSDGRILLLTSSFTKGVNWSGFGRKLIKSKKIFFEELYVWEVWKG